MYQDKEKQDTDLSQIFGDPDSDRGSVKIVGDGKGLHDERLRQRFAAFIDKHPHLTTAVLGRKEHVGVSRTALDLLLIGEYFTRGGQNGGPVNPQNSQVETKLRDYLDRMEHTSPSSSSSGFVSTMLSRQMEFACNTAIKENRIVVAYGSPGHGKSVSLQHYMISNLTTQPIMILCSPNITPGYFVKRLADQLGLKGLKSIPDTEDRIAEELMRRKRIIFIDQANYLNERSLGTICHIWNRAQVGIVLAGTYKLYDLFTKLPDSEDIKAQLASRVGMFVPLMGLSLEELKSITHKTLGEYATSDVVKEIFNLIAVARLEKDGTTTRAANYRHLDFLFSRLLPSIGLHKEIVTDDPSKLVDLVKAAADKLMID